MKKNKLLIDLLMIIILFIVVNVSFTGVLLHELIGISIWILFIIHLIINYKWIKSVTKNIFKSNIKKRIKKLYIIDLGLFISFIIITFSGISISQKLFTYLNANDIYFWTQVHRYSSYLAILLTSIHIIMHYDFFEKEIKKILDKYLNSEGKANILSIVLISISIVLLTYNLLANKIKEIVKKTLESDSINQTEVSENDNNNAISTIYYDSKEENNEKENITLVEYLGKLVCTGCHKKCLLSNPQCSRGDSQAIKATQNYNEIYK